MRNFNKTVHPFDFENLSSSEFERLVFAFLCRRWAWKVIDWYGQLGDDDGRDIIGVREEEWGRDETVVVACANWRRLTAEKALGDLDKLAAATTTLPQFVLVLAGGKVSADLKRKVARHAQALRLPRVEVWSGPEFEEHLRCYAETVARRFFAGEELPDEPIALRAFVADTKTSDEEGLRLVARVFDRPAFQTPFQKESSIAAFRQALSNTVEALNTGLWRARDGAHIGRVPSKNDFNSADVRAALGMAVTRIIELRGIFDDAERQRHVVRCACSQPDCPVFTADLAVVQEMNRRRLEILEELRRFIPDISVPVALRHAQRVVRP